MRKFRGKPDWLRTVHQKETPVQSDNSAASSGLETESELEQEDDLEVKPLEQKTDQETWQIKVCNKGCKHRLSGG